MNEIRGNLWDYHNLSHIIAITTNGVVKANGEAVMGRGCALEAKTRIPALAKRLGQLITERGNHVHSRCPGIVSFPVKHHWRDKADLSLIRRSAIELAAFATTVTIPIILPRPGCGAGGIRWEDDKPVLEPIFSDQVLIISF